MKKGIVLFAIQGSFDYVTLAVKSANIIKGFTNLPISVITNEPSLIPESLFDQIIIVEDSIKQNKRFYNGKESSEIHNWKNSSRSLIYDLTPYDHTLVLDSDYIINSNFLFNCFNIDKDFLIFKDGYDLSNWRNTNEFKYINQFSVPFYWATVFMFKKTKKNNIFFQTVNFIKNNWEYYRLLYQIVDTTYRNDFAFSIAIHILYGSKPNGFQDVFPNKMFYTLDRDHLLKLNDNEMLFALEQEGLTDYMPFKIKNIDVHIMNKYSLMKVLS